MTSRDELPADATLSESPGQALRRRAEEIARERVAQSPEDLESLSPEETRRTLHDLRVHQIELEMQNEELRRSQVELDASRAQYFDFYDLAPVGYCTLSEQGLILQANLTAAGLLGVARGALVRQPFSRFVLDADGAIYYLHRKRLFESGEAQSLELRMLKNDGMAFWAHLAATAAQDADGAPVCRLILEDITARKQAEEALRVDEERLRATAEETARLLEAEARSRRALLSVVEDQRTAEDALRESKAKLQKAQRYAHVGSWTWNVKTGQLDWSDEMFRIFGLARETFSGSLDSVIAQAIHPDDRQRVEEANLSVINAGVPIPLEYRVIWPDQSVHVVWAEAGELLFDEAGAASLISGTVQEITERKRAEEALLESERRFREMQENVELLAVMLDAEGRVTFCNDYLLRLTGRSRADVLGQDWFVMFVPPEAHVDSVFLAAMRQDALPAHFENEILTTLGERRWVSWNNIVLRDAEGRAVGASSIGEDVTDRRKAEQALRESEMSLAEAQRLAHIGNWRLTLATDTVHWSAELCDIVAHDPALPPPGFANMSSFYTPESWQRLTETVAATMVSGEPYSLDLDVVRTDGIVRATHARGTVERDARGAIVGLHGTVQDITERRQAVEEIGRMAQALDSAPNSVTVHDFAGRFLYANQRTFEMHGYRRDEFMALDLAQLDVPEDAALVAARMQELRDRGEASFELAHFRKDGTTLPLAVSIKVTTWGGRDAILSVATDITARKQAEAEMTRLRQAVAASSDAIFMTDNEGVITFVNPGFTELYGFTAQDVVGRATPRVLKSGAMAREAYEAFWGALRDRQEVKGELVNRTKDGRLLTIEGSANAVLDETGQVVGFLAIQRDITERKAAEAEILRLNENLERRVVERTARLAAANKELETFSYSISHDLRAPLRAISGFASILGKRYRDRLDEKGRHYVDTIAAEGEHLGTLIEELLDYAQMGRHAARARPVPLGPLVAQLRATFGEQVAAEGGILEVIEPLAVPKGDPVLLERILVNLVENALTYRRPDRAPHVTLSAVRHDDWVVISVADNGIGIPPAYREKIFEVFTRLHGPEAYPGTGIGLSIVRRAARLMGSEISLESVEGEGSTFGLTLPAAPAARERTLPAAPPAGDSGEPE